MANGSPCVDPARMNVPTQRLPRDARTDYPRSYDPWTAPESPVAEELEIQDNTVVLCWSAGAPGPEVSVSALAGLALRDAAGG